MEKTLFSEPDIRLKYGVFPVPDIENENKPYLQSHTNFCELLCVFQGKGTVHVEGAVYPMQSGDFLVMRPGEAHYLEVDPAVPYDRAVFYFKPGILDSIDPDRSLLRLYFDREPGKHNLYHRNANCLSIVKKAMDQSSRVDILLPLIQVLQLLGASFQELVRDAPAETLEYQVIRYINDHPQENFTTQALCGKFFTSRTQLYRRFKKATGISLGDYIANRRMATAQQLLLEGGKPTEIYTKCGFRDYSTFYRAYVKHFGYSPNKETGSTLVKPENESAIL